ncbi:DinB family protein [Psychroserpens ponticola]|uniref:DinB family protein n=1 Tax=Psychroserpens ponticola TaxID=2932268 RepID=A0ABY7S1J4_9FLAO|nr:DinB family protein [Psychroserpens ponticola]WCO03266.1 DinB family protein [Psychroserpens ponticola]
MTKDQLNANEFIPYYQNYIDKAGELNLIEGLTQNGNAICTFLESISKEKYDYAYEDGKWTIKELIQHIIDTERVFSFRALAFARKDKTLLPGYDQDEYGITSNANKRTKQSILKEYKALRVATIALFESFTDDMLKQFGNASNNDISVRAIGFVLIGHENHHCNIIKERYL